MKFCALLLASTAAAASLSFFGSEQHTLDEPFPIPGDNPLIYCEDPKDFLLNVTKVDLDPNPPAAYVARAACSAKVPGTAQLTTHNSGKTLQIAGEGSIKQTIEKGAKIHVQVKYGVIRLINQELDLCDYAAQANLECPLKEGPLKLAKSVDLPSEIPPGKYTVLANVVSKDDKPITCFTSTISFNRGGMAGAGEDL